MSTSRTICLGVMASLACAIVAPASAQQQQKPNILVIMGDDIGYWNISAYNRGMMGYRIRRHWVLFLIPGLVMAVLGLLAAALPFISTLVVETFAGWLFLTGGFVGLAALFTTRSMPGFVWTLLSAVLAILIGAFLVWRPFAGVVTLTLALAAFFAAHGITQILTSLHHRRLFAQSWLWIAISGIADLILAGIIIAGWPGSVAWALGLLIGINLFMSGLALVMTAIACRSVDHTPGPAEQSVHAA